MPPAPPPAYRTITAFLRLAVSAFFRRVDVTGLKNIPEGGGGLLVSWHPNGLVDPGLILTQLPRQVIFGARHGLFKFPILGQLLKQVGTVPIYRASDVGGTSSEDRRAANAKSLDALAGEVAKGSFSALFPEGISHDEPFLQGLKTGAARLYYRARQLQASGDPPPRIIPVGLHYDGKQMFRSNAMVAFHPALELPPELDVTPEADVASDEGRELARKLTDHLEGVLRDVVHATEDWELHKLMHRTRRLVRAERAVRAGADPGKSTISERVLGFARVRAGYYARLDTNPEEVAQLRERVSRYDEDLRALRLEDYDIDRDPKLLHGWFALILVLQAFGVFLLLPPLVLIGYLVNLPTALALIVLARLSARKLKDEATVKLLVGLIVFPATWIVFGISAALAHDELLVYFPHLPSIAWLTGSGMAIAAGVGGAVGLRYWRVARETARAVRVRLTRRRQKHAIAHLRVERAELHDAILDLVEGIELPGEVAPDGKIHAGD